MSRITWTESFNGQLGRGQLSTFNAALLGNVGRPASLAIKVAFDDVEKWIAEPEHPGTVVADPRYGLICNGLDITARVTGGQFEIWVPAEPPPWSDYMHRRMRYTVRLEHEDTEEQFVLEGFKLIENDPGFDAWSDTTTLFTRVYRYPDREVYAEGVLRMSVPGFARELLSFRGHADSLFGRQKDVLRYQYWFLRRLARTYVGRPVTLTRPSFPIDRPTPDWEVPKKELSSEAVPGASRLKRRTVPFDVEDLDFSLNVQQLRLAEGADTPRDDAGAQLEIPKVGNGEPVLLIPGSGVRANMFYGQPVGISLAEYLLRAEFDVWVENWRASIDLPPNRYTLDAAARFDHPKAVETVLTETGKERLRTVVHCQGSVSFLMSYVSGFLQDTVSHVVSSAVSLFVDVKWQTWLKQRVAAPIVEAATPWMDAQWGLRSDTPFGAVLRLIAKASERPCGNPACQLANFMYGSGWDTLLLHCDKNGAPWIAPEVHEWAARELGYTPMSFIDQISDSSRYGHVVPADPRWPGTPATYISPPRPGQSDTEPPCFTFIAGDGNRMFRWQGQERAKSFMSSVHNCPATFVGLPGFGHLDTIWGIEAPTVVYPVILDGLIWDHEAGGEDPLARARNRAPQLYRELNPDWPLRRGRFAGPARNPEAERLGVDGDNPDGAGAAPSSYPASPSD